MIKSFLFIAVFVFLTGWLASCSKTESDNNPPSFSFGSIRSGDTIVTDSAYTFEVKLSDNKGLSSYSINIWNALLTSSNDERALKSQIDSILSDGKDSAVFNSSFQRADIFGQRDTVIVIKNAFSIDSTVLVSKGKLPIMLGKHYFKFTLADMHGNMVRDSFFIYVKRRVDFPVKD